MRILLVNSIQLYGGGEVWMVEAAGELVRRGHEVTLVCRPQSPLEHHAGRASLHVLPLDIHGDFDPRTVWRMARIIGRHDVDIILTNMDKELHLAGAAALLCRRPPAVICRKGIDRPLKNTLGYRLTYNRLAACVIANSRATRQTLMQSAPWLDPARVHAIHNGIDPVRYEPASTRDIRRELGLPPGVPVAGFVGRLCPQKGIEFLLPAFRQVAARHRTARLLLVGEGELRNMVEDFARENGLQERIHLAGFRSDIPDVMRSIDVCVLPSLWEGFGIALIEAMAAGRPCVATRTSSIPEIVRDGETGILVPPRDADRLAAALLVLLDDPAGASLMGEAGRRVVQENFTLAGMIDRYEQLFRACAHRRGRAGTELAGREQAG